MEWVATHTCGRELYVRRAGLAAVGPGDDGCCLHPSARAHPEIRVYSKRSLENWASRTCAWLNENRDMHVYFDNDAEGAAPENALTLLQMLR